MSRPSLRQRIGAAVMDVPRLAGSLASRSGWIRFHNRRERLTIDPATGGARCEWVYTTDLHVSHVFPATGRLLMQAALRDRPVVLRDAPVTREKPSVSFVIGHRGSGRVPHLLATLRSIAAQTVAAECIVVEQAAEAGVRSFLPAWVRYLHTPARASEPYNRSAAFNAGAAIAGADVLVFHDNDMLVPSCYAQEIVERRRAGFEFLDLKRFIFYAGAEASGRIGDSLSPLGRFTPETIVQNASGGSIAADAAAFRAIGGFDEEFVGWGGEDNDFWDRARTRRTFGFGYLPFIHLWHPPQTGKPEAQSNRSEGRYGVVKQISPADRIGRLLRTKEPTLQENREGFEPADWSASE